MTERIFCFVCRKVYPLHDSHLSVTSLFAATCRHDFDPDYLEGEGVCSHCGLLAVTARSSSRTAALDDLARVNQSSVTNEQDPPDAERGE